MSRFQHSLWAGGRWGCFFPVKSLLPLSSCLHGSSVWEAGRNGRRLGNFLFAQFPVTSGCLYEADVCSCLLFRWACLEVLRDFLAGPFQALRHIGQGSFRGPALRTPNFGTSYWWVPLSMPSYILGGESILI